MDEEAERAIKARKALALIKSKVSSVLSTRVQHRS